MIVIYTADVEKAPEEFSAGCLSLKMEQAFLSKIDSETVQEEIKEVVRMTQVAGLLLEEGRKEGLILSGKIFRVVRECSDLTNERIAEEVGCSVEEVESARKIFDI